MAARANPLDSKAASLSANNFKIPPIPRLSDFPPSSRDGFDEAMEEWRQNLERTIVEYLSAKTLPTSKP